MKKRLKKEEEIKHKKDAQRMRQFSMWVMKLDLDS